MSRKFNNSLFKLLDSIAADADSLRSDAYDQWRGADPHVDALSNLEQQEIGDANPMCHIITFRKRLQSLSNVAGNCMRDIVFQDCCQPFFLAHRTPGIYPIEHGRKGYAYCDMKTDGGGWLVIARRAGGKRDFNKTWRHYKKGFGPLDKDFWIGLDAMFYLTHPSLNVELRFDIRHENGSWFHAYYNQVIIGPESDNYRLTVRGYDPTRSTIYDSFSAHDDQPFSTKDKVNVDFQPETSSCPRNLNTSGAGWWWRPRVPCNRVNMNQEYHVVYNSKGDTFPRGIGWCAANSSACMACQFIEMKVRPKQWHCGNLPRIPWEITQQQFLYRDEDEDDDDDEDDTATTVAPEELADNTTSMEGSMTTTPRLPVPDAEKESAAPTTPDVITEEESEVTTTRPVSDIKEEHVPTTLEPTATDEEAPTTSTTHSQPAPERKETRDPVSMEAPTDIA